MGQAWGNAMGYWWSDKQLAQKDKNKIRKIGVELFRKYVFAKDGLKM